MSGAPLAELAALVDRGLVRVLDLVFLSKTQDGTVRNFQVSHLDGVGEFGLESLEGTTRPSGLLGTDEVGALLDLGSAAAVVLDESLWQIKIVVALREAGAELVGRGGVLTNDLLTGFMTVGESRV